MKMIYVPKGKAREYSPFALNTYSGGCDHACSYCYCAGINPAWSKTPMPRDLRSLSSEARQASEQILLCFMSDPYCSAERIHRNTRKALNILSSERCSVAILTKGGTRCLDDLDLFTSWPDGRIKVGATLTFNSGLMSSEVETGAASPSDRIEALKVLNQSGVKTWASIEPVIDPEESLAIINASLPYVDAYKVGKLNHKENSTDWKKFGMRAVEMIRAAGKPLYVKIDLRPFFPANFLREEEIKTDVLNLPSRK